MDDGTMRIAELARQTGTSTSALRYYEEQGLLHPDGRTEAGYRIYGCQAVGRVSFIHRAKALGLTLREIQQLLREPLDPATDHVRLGHAIAHKLADTERRIAELEALRDELTTMHARLVTGARPGCGRIGDCGCWLPLGKEVEKMAANQTHACSCCGCTCPSAGGSCSCCGCPGS